MGNSGSTREKKRSLSAKSPYYNQLEALFDEHFRGPTEGLSDALFTHICKIGAGIAHGEQHHPSVVHHNKQSFIENAHDFLEQAFKVKDSTIRFYFELMVGQDAQTTLSEVKKILQEACLYAMAVVDAEAQHEIPEDDPVIDSLAKSCVVEHTSVCKDKFCNWALDLNPKIFSGLEAWLHERFTGHVQRGHFHMLPMPDMTISEHSFSILTPSLLWYLCCVLPICYTRLEKSQSYNQTCDSLDNDVSHDFTWNIIYDSNEHGLSLNRFKHKCLNYPSPTVTLVKFTSGLLLVMALDQPWRDSSDKFGDAYSCLLEIIPSCSSIIEGQNIFYLRETTRSAPKGLLVGGGLSPKVKIEADLSSAVLFYKGSKSEEISKMEVWGCGGVLAAAAQKKQMDWEKKEIEKMRKVKRPGRWDDNPDKQILDMAGIQTSHSQRGDI